VAFPPTANGDVFKNRDLPRCFAAARTTKHLSFSAAPTDIIFSDALYVFTTDRWDLFTVAQSTLHRSGPQV